ncbi:hypothetical protein OS493_029410 [Desmophyllum pertusum]|uniref:Uncharacterized protein n=1 Tax=Desmophyllum pertusum TaxID=174260 RepID=A0A9W9YWW2_9CNID|nr:hypothetical protein OS493_029410 [Desmophyllum pertusum]
MASFVKCGACAVFFALIITQCVFLAAYPATYNDSSNWYYLTVTFAPAVIVWFCSAKLRHLFGVWVLYILALITSIAFVFGVVGDSINKDRFLGPNALKLVLCITPLLLLLLLHTADDWEETDEHRELVSKLSFHMAIDLFDVVDMIDIVLEEYEHDIGIPKGFGTAMIVVACYTLLLSPWQLAENKLAGGNAKIRFRTAIIRNVVEIIFVNLTFLVIRLVVFSKYGKDESIFIAKNGIAIVLSLLDIRHLWSSHSS